VGRAVRAAGARDPGTVIRVYRNEHRRGYAAGLGAAVLFGASAPFAKRLAGDADPQLLAGLLYGGAFLALAAGIGRRDRTRESPISRIDLPLLVGVIISGGVIAPVMLMLGLRRLDAVPASLLLNLEGPFTLVIGLTIFREHLGRRAIVGAGLVFVGAAALTAAPGAVGRIDVAGAFLVVGACAAWGVDNNLTQRLTLRDPFAIVLVKTSSAAFINVPIAIIRGSSMPQASVIGAALLIGAVSYGLSILLDAYALRHLGAAREAVIFATAPLAGVAIAVLAFGDQLRSRDMISAAVMAVGTGALLRSVHAHEHTHEHVVHEHRHVHDDHHRHDHGPGVDAVEPHSHRHEHEPLVHDHSHVSDAHHRHGH